MIIKKKEIEKNTGNENQNNNKKRKEKKLKQEMEEVIGTFKHQIKQLKETIVIMCSTIVKDDAIKETIIKKMEQINNVETQEKEMEEVTQNYQNKKQTYFQRYQKDRNEQNVELNENEKKKLKVKGHPKLSIDVTGDVQAKIDWHNRMRQEKLVQSQRAQTLHSKNE